MKKMIIAAAVASVLAPATVLADTTLYGALRMSAVGGDKGVNDLGGLKNNASRIGLKGTYGEAGGLQGFFNLQGGIDVDGSDNRKGSSGAAFSSRFAFAGIKGGFGKAVMGRISTPYKMAGLKIDPFYDTSAGPTDGGSNYGLSSFTNGWRNNAIGYVSPKLGGAVTVNIAGFLSDDDNGNQNSLIAAAATASAGAAALDATAAAAAAASAADPTDASLLAASNVAAQAVTDNNATIAAGAAANNNDNAYNVGATYSKNGITASVQHLVGFNGDDDDEATRVTASYKGGAFSVGLSFEDVDPAGRGNGHEQTYLAGTYKVAPKTTLAASFGNVEDNGGGARDSAGDGFTVGVFHKVASQTTVSALYSEVDYDAAATADRDVFALGLIQKF